MGKYRFFLLFVPLLLCCGTCQKDEAKYNLTIVNNSDKEIITVSSLSRSIALDTTCLTPTIRREYFALKRSVIKPYDISIGGVDDVVEDFHTNPNLVWSIGVFYWEDVDKMSCEEFKRVYPLKQYWDLTLEDLEACNWMLVFSPEE